MNMSVKKFTSIFVLFAMLGSVFSSYEVKAGTDSAPLFASGDLIWAKGIGGTENEAGFSITTDTDGNVYTTGHFRGTVDFDPGIGTVNLTANGIQNFSDGFVAKYTDGGDLIWAKQIGSWDGDVGRDVKVDTSGNVYVIGGFASTVDFDPGVGFLNITSAGERDIFILKLDSNGDFLWAKSIGGIFRDEGYKLDFDPSGNVYLLTVFSDTVDFNPGAGIFNLTSNNAYWDIAVVKLDAAGDFVWAKGFGGASDDYVDSFTVDNSGNIYITGSFDGTVDFDPGAGTANLTSNFYDAFVSALDSNGNFLWVKSIGGSGIDDGMDIALDLTGNIYLTGDFEGTVDFNPDAVMEHELTSAGGWDAYILKLSNTGNFIWVNSIGGSGDDWANDVETDESQNVYFSGSFEGVVDFDPSSGTVNLTSAGLSDIFMANFDGTGNLAWAKNMGGPMDDFPYGLDLDSGNNAVITGNFKDTADFDPGVGTTNLTSSGGSDIFIVKIEGNHQIFNDVPATHWAWQYIESLATAGITGGCGAGNYCPNNQVTRAQMAVFLLRGIHGSSYTPPAATGTVFNDVGAGDFAAAWIEQMVSEGITSGCGGGNYCPNATVTRAQMAVFLLRAKYGSGYTPPAATGTVFTDVPSNGFAAAWIEQLVVEGVTSGCGGGNYCPNQAVTRAQMAVFLVRIFNLP